jgi:polysaccharide deacetylase 2 family uncharacterized protein YibQ
MARKRSRRRGSSPAPFLFAALLLAAVVAWAIYPRTRAHHASHHTVAVAASPSLQPPQARIEPPASPSATQTPAPASSPAASPQAAQSPRAGRVQVALIIDDCGQWLPTEQALIALPIPITLSVLPHVHYTDRIAQEAAAAGKGVMLHLPMEPLSHINPGPGEIKDAMTDDEVTKQTEDDLAQVPLAKGANNHEGSEASADERVMKDVIAVMKAHDLFFVDSRTNAKSVGQSIAQADGVPAAKRDVFLDNQADVAYTESMLERTVAIAKRNGSAIAIGHPKPTTLAAIRELYSKMQAEGVQFVLAQDLVH